MLKWWSDYIYASKDDMVRPFKFAHKQSKLYE